VSSKPPIEVARISRARRAFFSLLLMLFGMAAVLAGTELLLRRHRLSIEKSNRLDPGLVRYDGQLGWRLSPNWQGRHRHYDFNVRYSTNAYGFRGDFDTPPGRGGHRYAVVGDSFTFGLGVNDGETFVSRMNMLSKGCDRYLNFGVPGFSTDQEYLLLQQRVFDFSPDGILLITYLGNDLFDNQLAFPLQARHGKPYFTLTDGRLVLENVPVPMVEKPLRPALPGLRNMVLGNEPVSLGSRMEGSEIVQLVRRGILGDSQRRDLFPQFKNRFGPALKLYEALLVRIRSVCRAHGVGLVVVLMPGQSFVERPGSVSAQFQDYFRAQILRMAARLGIEAIDVAQLLRDHAGGKALFYPHEGHLTEAGNLAVAEIIKVTWVR